MAFVQTPSLKVAEAQNNWYVVDAANQPLGRLSTHIATYLRGKHKPNYTPHINCGDHVVVINAEQVKLTGHKRQNMTYYYHTGYIGGIKGIVAGHELDGDHPERVIERAVKRMLPKESSLARTQLTMLHVYKGGSHPHTAQQPKAISFAKEAK
jgi:large subunit ribosomal protein L13